MKRTQDKALSNAPGLIVKSGTDLSNLFKQDGLVKQLTKGLVKRVIQVEMKEYLSYERY